MQLLIQHCNLAIFKDRKGGKHRSNRPKGVKQYPSEPGKADVMFLTPVSSLKVYDNPRRNRLAQEVLREFQNLSLFEPGGMNEVENGLIDIRIEYLVEKIGLKDEADANRILRRLNAMGLLKGLTIDYDHTRWMKHSRIKGCLVVNVCILKSDYRRKALEKKVASVILKLREKILRNSKRGSLKHIFIVPNAHLAPKNKIGDDNKKDVSILRAIERELKEEGFDAVLNSYGYAKDIVEAINAYKGGYVFRTV